MTAQHMAMVAAAEGLNPPQKMLLTAYAFLADDHGYIQARVLRLVDQTGLCRDDVLRTNAALRAKRLIKSTGRTDPETGHRLIRLNVPRLDSMRRRNPA